LRFRILSSVRQHTRQGKSAFRSLLLPRTGGYFAVVPNTDEHSRTPKTSSTGSRTQCERLNALAERLALFMLPDRRAIARIALGDSKRKHVLPVPTYASI
jgi:hypothetical protein